MAFLALNTGKNNLALSYFERAFKKGKLEFIIPLIDLNIRFNNLDQAEKWLNKLRRIVSQDKSGEPLFVRELEILENKLHAEQVNKNP